MQSPLEMLLEKSPRKFEKAIERGLKAEFVIHKNTHPLLRKYASDGKIQLFYTPIPPSHKVEIYEHIDKNVEISLSPIWKEDTLVLRGDPEAIQNAENYIRSIEKYPLPQTKVNIVFLT